MITTAFLGIEEAHSIVEREQGGPVPKVDENSATPPISRMRHYANILNPLFWSDGFNRVDRMFEWACTMVRVTGLKDTGWDSYTESIALLEDFTQLMGLELPKDRFPNPANTQALTCPPFLVQG